ncbi:MAG: uridine nucleosidase [Acidimicrobiaceae bacterium]|jgi:purine nucleosidase
MSERSSEVPGTTPPGEPRRPVVVDTDGGVDDAVALWWVLTDPSLDVVAITVVWGNVPIAVAADSVLRVVEAAGRHDVPVAVGEAEAYGLAPKLRPATFIHGDDGLGNCHRPAPGLRPVDEPAVTLLQRVFRARPHEVSLITLGPLTNIARALLADPAMAESVADLVVMGGSTRFGGNALPAGEANIAHDPEAAQIVVAAPWRSPPLLVGLDVTMQATLTEDEFALLAPRSNDASAFLDEPLRFYRAFGSSLSTPECPCHDLLAVLAFSHPDVVVDAPVLPLAVDTGGGAAWGATVVDFRAPKFDALEGSDQPAHAGFHPWRIALDVDVARFRQRFRELVAPRHD